VVGAGEEDDGELTERFISQTAKSIYKLRGYVLP
jgi:hypothetical protein